MSRISVLGAGVISAALLAAAVASGADTKQQDAPKAGNKATDQVARAMRLMDVDGDNRISPAEYKAWRYRVMQRRFAGQDANRDGKLDLNESLTASAYGARSSFFWLDTANKGFKSDGFIDRTEAAEEGRSPEWFARRDANGDGKLDWTEFYNVWQSDHKAWFAKQDSNGDGKLDFAESHRHLDNNIAREFKDYDTNGDGFISETEFVALAVRIAKERAEREFQEIDE